MQTDWRGGAAFDRIVSPVSGLESSSRRTLERGPRRQLKHFTESRAPRSGLLIQVTDG